MLQVFLRSLPGLVVGSVLSTIAPGPAVAAGGGDGPTTGVVDWPTFFRTGPGRQYVVLEELARGRTVDVLGCAGQWCTVQVGRVVGYVDQANLVAAAPPTLGPQSAAGCFDSQRSGYGTGEALHYCPR